MRQRTGRRRASEQHMQVVRKGNYAMKSVYDEPIPLSIPMTIHDAALFTVEQFIKVREQRDVLREALKRIDDTSDRNGHEDYEYAMNLMGEIARAAIAKAEGRS